MITPCWQQDQLTCCVWSWRLTILEAYCAPRVSPCLFQCTKNSLFIDSDIGMSEYLDALWELLPMQLSLFAFSLTKASPGPLFKFYFLLLLLPTNSCLSSIFQWHTPYAVNLCLSGPGEGCRGNGFSFSLVLVWCLFQIFSLRLEAGVHCFEEVVHIHHCMQSSYDWSTWFHVSSAFGSCSCEASYSAEAHRHFQSFVIF